MVAASVEQVEAVYGRAEGSFQSSSSNNRKTALLPFLFSFVPTDRFHLCLSISDFHSQTWRSEFSVDELQALRDEVGIGGSWNDFLGYLRAALLSNNVKLELGGPASVDGHGASSTIIPLMELSHDKKVVAQKTKGTPRLSLALTKLEGLHAQDAMGSISVGLFQAFHAQSSALAAEKARVSYLDTMLGTEKARCETLQEQIDSSRESFTVRKKHHRDRASQLFSTPGGSQFVGLPPTQIDMKEVMIPSQPPAPTALPVSGISEQSKDGPAAKPPDKKGKVHSAPASRRVKRRGTTISEGAE